MINPAQFNEVLSKASDQQLMALLKRPDKIPSQFVVSEINRRQTVRQAAQAQQRQQAIAQEQQRAAQNMGAQMRAPRLQNPNNMRQPMQQPIGMSQGGIPPVRSIGDFPTFLEYKMYMDNRAEAIRQQRALAQDRASSIEEMAKITTADAGMTDIDPGKQVLGAGEAAALDDAGMTDIDAGIRKPFFEFGGFNPGAAFSDGSPMDIGRAVAALAPDIKVGPVRPENAFSDGSPADIPKALAAGARKVASSLPQIPPAEPYSAKDSARKGAFEKFLNYGGVNRGPSIYAKRAAQDAEQAELEAAYGGIKNFDFPNIVPPETKAPEEESVKKAGAKQNSRIDKDLYSYFSGTNKEGATKKTSPGTKRVIDANLQAAEAELMKLAGVGKKSGESEQAATSETGGGIKSVATETSGDGPNRPGTLTVGGANNQESIRDVVSNKLAEKGTFKKTSIADIVARDQVEIGNLREKVLEAKGQALNERKVRLDELTDDLSALTDAKAKLLSLYDETASTPENRIFTAMIDAGLALAGSKNANFLQAVAEAGKAGVESFNNLNKEAKENLFKKYSAAVDMAAQEVEIKQAINSELSGISADRVAIDEGRLAGRVAESAAMVEAAKSDTGSAFQEGEQNIREASAIGTAAGTDVQNALSAERNQIAAYTANTAGWQAIQNAENDDERLALAREELERTLGVREKELNANNLYRYLQFKENQYENDLRAEGLDIERDRLNKDSDSVARLKHLEATFGRAALLKILAPESSGALIAKDMDKMAVDLAAAAAKSMEEIPDPQNPGQNLENPQMEDYLRHYRQVVPSVFGSAAGGQQSGDLTYKADGTLS
jgi:hypothetical protein